ncbi:unnamed protein product, partial [Candidula unifasciata]
MFRGRSRGCLLMILAICVSATVWTYSRLPVNKWKMTIKSFLPTNTFRFDKEFVTTHLIPELSLEALHSHFSLDVNMSALKY